MYKYKYDKYKSKYNKLLKYINILNGGDLLKEGDKRIMKEIFTFYREKKFPELNEMINKNRKLVVLILHPDKSKNEIISNFFSEINATEEQRKNIFLLSTQSSKSLEESIKNAEESIINEKELIETYYLKNMFQTITDIMRKNIKINISDNFNIDKFVL